MKKTSLTLISSLALSMSVLASPASAYDDLIFKAKLTGDAEIPTPVVTTTTGRTKLIVDEYDDEIRFKMIIRDADGIFGGPGAHIHCGAADENGPIIAFLAGGLAQGLSGTVKVSGTLTDDNIIPTDCGSDVESVTQSMKAGKTYVNIHSKNFPAGEIRGQIFKLKKNTSYLEIDKRVVA